MFGEYIEYYYIVPIISFIIATLMLVINYWDVTELEKRLMSNFQKLKIYFSLNFIGAIMFTVFILGSTLVKGVTIDVNLIIGVFILTSITLQITSSVIWMAEIIFTFKPKYTILLENDPIPWNVYKAIGNKKIMLYRKRNEFKFISDYNNLLIEKEEFPSGWRQSFYKRNQKFYITVIVFSAMIIFGFFFLFGTESAWRILIATLFIVIGVITNIIICLNYYLYKVFSD